MSMGRRRGDWGLIEERLCRARSEGRRGCVVSKGAFGMALQGEAASANVQGATHGKFFLEQLQVQVDLGTLQCPSRMPGSQRDMDRGSTESPRMDNMPLRAPPTLISSA